MAASLNVLGSFLQSVMAQADENPWNTADSMENILLYPQSPGPMTNGTLVHTTGGLTSDDTLRPRVSAIIGPGATPRGLARKLLPLYTAAPGTVAPTVDEIARALLVYNQDYLPASSMEDYRVGLRFILPIERDNDASAWVLDSEAIREWSASFEDDWTDMLDQRPGLLEFPNNSDAQINAFEFLARHDSVEDRALALASRAKKNPFEVVLPAFEIFHQLASDAFSVALHFVEYLVPPQLELLASLTAGSGLLQRLEMLLNAPPPDLPEEESTRRTQALELLNQTLRPGGLLVPAREVPETAQQLSPRGTPSNVPDLGVVRATGPTKGEHRMVLGRDVLAGTTANYMTYRGPAYGGRLDTNAFMNSEPVRINPFDDPQLRARLNVVSAIAPNEAFLDGVRLRDSGIVSSGLHQWTVHGNNELTRMLFIFKEKFPADFMLFFRLYGLDFLADPTHPTTQAIPQQVNADGTLTALTSYAQRRDFFGGTVNPTTNRTEFSTLWAARIRMAALASVDYKAAQCLRAAERFDALRNINLTVQGTARTIRTVFTSIHAAALILDHHINAPGNVQPNLTAAIASVGSSPSFVSNPTAFERSAMTHYAANRVMAQGPERAERIIRLNLPSAHGTFNGW